MELIVFVIRQKVFSILIFLFSLIIVEGCKIKRIPDSLEDNSISYDIPDSVMFRIPFGYFDSLLRVELKNYISTSMVEINNQTEGIPIVGITNNNEILISYILNKSELYYCVFSYYSLVNNIPVLVYDQQLGYLNIDAANYSKVFLNRVENYLNDDMSGKIVKDVVEVDGEKQPVEGWKFINSPITYNPKTIRLSVVNGSLKRKSEGDFNSSFNYNCNFGVDLEYRFEVIENP